VTVQRDKFELRTQLSSKPIKYLITGIEMMMEMSLADVSLASLATLFNTSVITSGSNGQVIVQDTPGQQLYGDKIILKPMIGATPDPNTNNWLTFLNAAPVDINNTDLTFGLQTQRALRITFYSLPFFALNPSTNVIDSNNPFNGMRAIFGTAAAYTPTGSVTPAISGFTPTTGAAAGGTSVTISGAGFTGATGVSFGTSSSGSGGKAAASFTVNSDTSITAVVAASSSSGYITVTPASGSVLVSPSQITLS
jgi:hypothetical protein